MIPGLRAGRRISIDDRIAFYIRVDPRGCWIWNGAPGSDGYGRTKINQRTVRAHRAVYEHLVGPIPKGLQLDHLCRVRRCVNPEHLEPVTSFENRRRSPINIATRNAAKATCPRGHSYDRIDPKTGDRKCRRCHADAARRAYRRQPRQPIPEAIRRAVMERDGYRCRACGVWHSLTIDHVRPVAAGGSDDLENLQTLCRSCNSSKGARLEWAG